MTLDASSDADRLRGLGDNIQRSQMLTADTITDEQIRALRDSSRLNGSYGTVQVCTDALFRSEPTRSAARAECVRIINILANGR